MLGSNGVGKTTLNTVLSGLLRATGRRDRLRRPALDGLTPAEIVELGLIHVPEGRRIFPDLSVRENLELGGYRRGKAEKAESLESVLAIFPRLAERERQAAGTLSGGEQQMLAIGRGLMARPRLLILDEPSLGLSPLLVEEMFALVERLHAQGLAILLVEQNVVQSLASRPAPMCSKTAASRSRDGAPIWRKIRTAESLSGNVTMTNEREASRKPLSLKSRIAERRVVLAPGVYDALTAALAASAGFEALYLSGAAIAYTRLGPTRHRPCLVERSRGRARAMCANASRRRSSSTPTPATATR